VPNILVKGSSIFLPICGKIPPTSAPTEHDGSYMAINGAARIRFSLNTPMIAGCSYRLSFWQQDGAIFMGNLAIPSGNCPTSIRIFGEVSTMTGSSAQLPINVGTASTNWTLVTATFTPTKAFDILEIATGFTTNSNSQYLFVDDVMLHRTNEVVLQTALDVNSVDTKPCRGNKLCV
jgi:hypothetical protein